MCPAHVDHQLTNLKASATAGGRSSTRKAASTQLENQRTFRTRKPKQATVVQMGLRRGFRNNGLIEIDEEKSDEDSEVEKEMSGVIYKVSERGIKLDFIDRIKRYAHSTPLSHQRITDARQK